jgi:hypothetical protein
MLRIQKLKRPSKLSGHNLPEGETTEVRGLIITNKAAGENVWFDKYTPQKKARKKK